MAPSALRSPISWVRSVTETIMMAMTPMPPTRRATPDRATITPKNAEVRLLIVSRIWSWVSRSKVFGTPGRSRRSRRSAIVTRSWARATSTSGRPFTEMNNPLVSSYRRLYLAERYGTMAPFC